MRASTSSRALARIGGDAMTLLEHHREMLVEGSAIAAAVIAERGYFSAQKKVELADRGFSVAQRIVPALVLPQHGVDGTIVNYQSRPDRPRIDANSGRAIKYESVAGTTGIRLDVPPRCRDSMARIYRPLWVTEGLKKGDALASHGLCAVALLGVWAWRAEEDWDRIALDERDVYVVYDNDVMVKPAVHRALEGLAAFLTARGGIVRFVYLPEDDGKLGVDDFLAAGHTVEELYDLAADELRPLPQAPAPVRRPAWPTGVLLWEIEQLLRRFVRFPSDHEPAALALYALHTWAIAAADVTPYLYVKSPQKRSGKTRLLEVLELICREALRAASVTEAAIYQAVSTLAPTLLLDEADAVFGARSERAEALRGVLNAGNRRGAFVLRGGKDGELHRYSVFCAKVLAGIDTGRLPDTIRDRSIIIGLERRLSSEPVDRLRRSDLHAELEQLTGRFRDWASEHHDALASYRAAPIIEISDRLEESWEPLLAIAELAGEDWPRRARDAALNLAPATEDMDAADHGQLLLAATRRILGPQSKILSKSLCAAVNGDEELPFGGYHNGTGVIPRDVARLLRPFGIKPTNVRTPGGQGKGYTRNGLAEAWARYAVTEDAGHDPSQPSPRPTTGHDDGAEPKSAGTDAPETSVPRSQDPSQSSRSTLGDTDAIPAGTDPPERYVPDPSPSQPAADRATGRSWDGGTDATDETEQLVRAFLDAFDAVELPPEEPSGPGPIALPQPNRKRTERPPGPEGGRERFVGAPCPDRSRCRYRWRHAAGAWTCEANHPRMGA